MKTWGLVVVVGNGLLIANARFKVLTMTLHF